MPLYLQQLQELWTTEQYELALRLCDGQGLPWSVLMPALEQPDLWYAWHAWLYPNHPKTIPSPKHFRAVVLAVLTVQELLINEPQMGYLPTNWSVWRGLRQLSIMHGDWPVLPPTI